MEEIHAILNAPNLQLDLEFATVRCCTSASLVACAFRNWWSLPLENLSLQRTPSIRVLGKGRKERCLPLWKETAADLRAWLAVRGAVPVPELFVNARELQ